MAEVAGESTHVWSSKPRTVMFLAAMRHFALALQAAGRPLHYTRLDAPATAAVWPHNCRPISSA
jgi:deoxyribodipyrimidine photolyase-related protein